MNKVDKPIIRLFNITKFEEHLRDVMLISGVEILEGENWWEAYVVEPNPILLLQEMIYFHSNPESPGYNDCDEEICYWCAQAEKIIKDQK